jgi:hypothetical protein
MSSLDPAMSVDQFDNGYWYVADLRELASRIRVPRASGLRKNELERQIRHFLIHGSLEAVKSQPVGKTGPRDLDVGLSLDLPVHHYTSSAQTKRFILAEALKLAPGLKKKSGVSYRLNRWREEQLATGREITYGDLVREFIALNDQDEFARIPHGRYINFIADYLQAEPGATRQAAIAAWHALKMMDVPKTYADWKQASAPAATRRAK